MTSGSEAEHLWYLKMDLFFLVFIEADNETRTETGQLEASAFNSRLHLLCAIWCQMFVGENL